MNSRIAKKIIAWPLCQFDAPRKWADGGTYPYTQDQFSRAHRKHMQSLRRGDDLVPFKWGTGPTSKRTRRLVKRLSGDHMTRKTP